MNEILNKIQSFGLVPVVKIDSVDDALPVAKALIDGGLPVVEITFRTACARDAITVISSEFPEMLVGAGTVLNIDQARDALAAGAKFIVSPGIDIDVVEYCLAAGVSVIPGCTTASDMTAAVKSGLDTVKFFPAEQAGGVAMLKALSGPFPGLNFMPTGGITLDNMLDYLTLPNVIAVGGSFMCPSKEIAVGDFGAVTAAARKAINTMFGFELKHIGVNCRSNDECENGGALLEKLFGFEQDISKGAIFSGGCFELLRKPYLGELGHIAIGTNFFERAMDYFKRMGLTFNEAQFKPGPDGKLNAAYFSEDFFGFAFHLLRK